MEKYLITIDQDNPEEITIEYDDPAYDGPETNIDDPEGIYHISADTADEAVDTAKFLDSIGNPSYTQGVLYESI